MTLHGIHRAIICDAGTCCQNVRNIVPERTELERLEGIWQMLESIESRLEQLSAQMDANYDVPDRTAAPFSQIAAKE